MAIEKTLKTNGYKIRSWGDVAAIVGLISPILVVAVAVILWGLKLEGELNVERTERTAMMREITVLSTEVARLKLLVSEGILNVARSEIDDLKEDDREIKRRLEKVEARR